MNWRVHILEGRSWPARFFVVVLVRAHFGASLSASAVLKEVVTWDDGIGLSTPGASSHMV